MNSGAAWLSYSSGVQRRRGRNRSGAVLTASDAALVPSQTRIRGPVGGKVLVPNAWSAMRPMTQSSAWELIASLAIVANRVASSLSKITHSTGPPCGSEASGPQRSAALGLIGSRISSATPWPVGLVDEKWTVLPGICAFLVCTS
jgi:hypothetical protein